MVQAIAGKCMKLEAKKVVNEKDRDQKLYHSRLLSHIDPSRCSIGARGGAEFQETTFAITSVYRIRRKGSVKRLRASKFQGQATHPRFLSHWHLGVA